MRWADEGAAYVPFCGDGDLAAELYKDRVIYAADLDPKRVEVCRARLPAATIIMANCDQWPFAGQVLEPIAVADFDAYAEPYRSFRAYWQNAPKMRRQVLLFTDGHRQGINRAGIWFRPDGGCEEVPGLTARRRLYNFYWRQVVEPWLKTAVAGWRIMESRKYLRRDMLYWGVALEEESGQQHGGRH